MASRMVRELRELSASDMYPFHMPGHKRVDPDLKEGGFAPYSLDITEIDGFDDMHDPQGLIKDLNERLSALFGGDESRILVNGSTSGVLAAISASVKKGGRIIMAANSHRSAFNAVYLRELSVSFLHPDEIPDIGISGGISPAQVSKAIEDSPDAEAVFLTSPTYEGVVSDIKGIAEICHLKGIPLIVDSAHGSHAGLYVPFEEESGFKEPLFCGADIAIKSLHKTLPCFTQTALLSVRGGLIDRERLWRFYSIYQTSSPSYVFMAGAEKMLDLLEKRGNELYEALHKELRSLREQAKKAENLKIPGPEYIGSYSVFGYDPTKIVLSHAGIPGKELSRILREEQGIQCEMAAGRYVLLMSSLMDSRIGFERLSKAIEEMDSRKAGEKASLSFEGEPYVSVTRKDLGMAGEIRISDAMDMEKEDVPLAGSEGRTSAEFIYAYPPGIPVICPGQAFTEEKIAEISGLVLDGLTVKGLRSRNFRKAGLKE